MSSLVISGDTSGAVTVSAPAVAGSNTLTLLAATATNSVNILGTAVASTSGATIDFTALPSWIKRITVMFNGVSLSGSAGVVVQIGSGSIDATSYTGASGRFNSGGNGYTSNSTSFTINTSSASASDILSGHAILTNISGNIWILSSTTSSTTASTQVNMAGGSKTLSGVLDRLRITSSNGTDTFDAGSVNILYEG
jgi:hypothetical protein